MHMSDALLSPVVGSAFWAASAGMISLSAKKIAAESDGSKTVLMGVLGAFVFAAQMVNFAIPGTGSSGHIGGGLLLAVLLGPWRAFITISSVLVIQALLFADGGLLALGCNIFNMGVFPAFIVWPFIYAPIAGQGGAPWRRAAGSVAAATAGLLMGAIAVVLQTAASGISDLPFRTFLLFMVPIHLAIGIVEGVVTWGVLGFVARTEPSLVMNRAGRSGSKIAAASLLLAALAAGGILSRFSSTSPDGLEWAILKTSGKEELPMPVGAVHSLTASIQEKSALLPDYGFRSVSVAAVRESSPVATASSGTSLTGILGSLLALILAGSAGLLLRKRASRTGS